MDKLIVHSPEIFKALLNIVVHEGVFSDSEREAVSGPLNDQRRKDIAAARMIDSRTPKLLIISGKGGWTDDVKEFAETRERFTNVSLLDHILSVVRGALVLGEIDLKASGVLDAEIDGRLALIAAVAFLHDADKMLEVGRSHSLTPGDLAGLMSLYRVDAFLAKYGQAVTPDEMVSLVDQVEPSRGGRMRLGETVLRGRTAKDCYYITLADRLDGAFLDSRKGIATVLKELANAEGLRSEGILRNWAVIDLVSPHTPFLLDRFQFAVSDACLERCGFPPLLETHHDGRLTLIVPEAEAEAIRKDALHELGAPFTSGMRIDNNARGARDILDAGGNVDDLRAAFDRMVGREAEKCLRVSLDTVTESKAEIASLLGEYGFDPLWPDLSKFPGRLVPVWSDAKDERMSAFVKDAAMTAVVLACAEGPKALKIPDATVREVEICAFIADHGGQIPDWLKECKDVIGRRTILAGLAAALVQDDIEARDALLEKDGLIDLWLAGTDARPGLSAKIDSAGQQLADAARAHIAALIGRRLVIAKDEDAAGRCHFTNAPVGAEARIVLKTGLYGLNVSAFSGREGRPEYFDKAEAQTLVSPAAQAEHRLRQLRGTQAKPGLPVYVSSPNSLGLFAALSYENTDESLDFSLTDLMRLTLTKGRVAIPIDPLEKRVRIGRYEEMPNSMHSSDTETGQIGFVRQVMEASLRMGRPIHVFRGMPIPSRAYVAFDFLPPALAEMLGGLSFRLEQVPDCLRLVRLVETVAGQNGMGVELAMAIADPKTRFAAACDALARLERLEKEDRGPKRPIRPTLVKILEDRKNTMTNSKDDALLRFGQIMATVQRAPIRSDGASVAEIGLRTSIEAADAAIRLGHRQQESLVGAVTESLQSLIERRGLVARSAVRAPLNLDQAVEKAAIQFVEEVWIGAFKGNSPSAKNRRTALAIYRYAFEKAARKGPTEEEEMSESSADAA